MRMPADSTDASTTRNCLDCPAQEAKYRSAQIEIMKLSTLAAEIDGADAAASNIKYHHYRQNEYEECESFRKSHGE